MAFQGMPAGVTGWEERVSWDAVGGGLLDPLEKELRGSGGCSR